MTDNTQPEALRLAVSSSAMADEGEMIHLLPWHEIRNLLRADATELRRLHAENKVLDSKLKVYEDLDEAASDVQLLRMGYAAARLEIESLRARSVAPAGEYPALPMSTAMHAIDGVTACWSSDQMRAYVDADRAMRAAQPAGAQQTGAAYAELPSPIAWAHWEASGFSEEPTRLAIKTSPPDEHEKRVANWFQIHSTDQMRTFADATHALRASHGQAPAQAAPAAVAGQEDDDSLMLCASDLEHSAIYDNHVEMQSCIRAVAVRVRALAAAPTTQPVPKHDGEFWPVDENASRKQLIAQIGQMNFRLTALRQENAGLIKRVAGQAEALQNYQRSHETAPQQEAQEPVMIYHGDCTIDCGEHGHHHVELLRMIPAGSKLYTAPQPSPASQGDALDAARYRWLRNKSTVLHNTAWLGGATAVQRDVDFLRRDDALAALDAAIDAARAAQEGKKP